MKKKRIVASIVCLLMLFILTGCSKKVSLTTADFIAIVEEDGYIVSDVKSQYASYEYINEATVAQSSGGWQVEFYVLDDTESAERMFDTNRTIFENSKSNASSQSSVSIRNYSTFSLTSGGYFMYLCQIDNTLLYVKVEDGYKDPVKALIDELGY